MSRCKLCCWLLNKQVSKQTLYLKDIIMNHKPWRPLLISRLGETEGNMVTFRHVDIKSCNFVSQLFFKTITFALLGLFIKNWAMPRFVRRLAVIRSRVPQPNLFNRSIREPANLNVDRSKYQRRFCKLFSFTHLLYKCSTEDRVQSNGFSVYWFQMAVSSLRHLHCRAASGDLNEHASQPVPTFTWLDQHDSVFT